MGYRQPDDIPKDSDVLRTFWITPQPGVPPEEAGAAVAGEIARNTYAPNRLGYCGAPDSSLLAGKRDQIESASVSVCARAQFDPGLASPIYRN